jgi:hypothetical protein
MTTLVTRLYKNRAEADAAAKAVLAKGYSKRLVSVVSADSKGSADALKATMAAAGIYPTAAGTYANRVAAGAALVAVKAPVGSYFTIRDALNDAGPIESGVKNEDVHVRSVEARPASRPRHTPVLISSGQTFLSSGILVPLMDFAWGGFSKDRPRWKYLTDFAWGSFGPDRPRSKYLSDFAWGGFSKDRPRWKYLSDRGWGGAR